MLELKGLSIAGEEVFYRTLEHRPQVKPSLETLEEFLREEERVKALASTGDWRGLRDFVTARSEAKIYSEALELQRGLFLELEAYAEKMLEPNRKSKLVNRDAALDGATTLRAMTLTYRDSYEAYAAHVARITEYRVLTARAALLSSLLRENEERGNGTFLLYDKETLGELVVGGDYEVNSPEWHAARAGGIGGSDVGAIMRADSAFGSQNYLRVLNDKLGLKAPEEDELSFSREDMTTAIGRGNAWEEFIRYKVQDLHPELRLAYCKSSWHGLGELSYRHANFDGLFLDENGEPEGVLEIKTGSNARKWGEESEGIFGVPPGYRKQVLWYAANAKLKYGKIVALLSDNDYREYDFSMDDPAIKQEVHDIYLATDAFWRELPAKRILLSANEGRTLSRYSSISAKESPDAISEVLSAYSDIPKATAKRMLVEALAATRKIVGKELSKADLQSVIFDVFSKHDPSSRVKPLVGVDIETSTTSARTGRIIETGIVKYSQESNDFEVIYDSIHGIPEVALLGVGVGATKVHHITSERVAHKALFEEQAEEILSLLMDSTLVAHNAGFEDRFLSANLPGYIEAKAAGRIIILDTRKVSKYLMPRSSDNTLQSFAEDNGVPYEGAHAASQDALMMMKALLRLQRNIYSGGRFITRRASASARMSAAQKALEVEAIR